MKVQMHSETLAHIYGAKGEIVEIDDAKAEVWIKSGVCSPISDKPKRKRAKKKGAETAALESSSETAEA